MAAINRSRGMSLVELMVALGVTVLIFSALAFMLIVTSRNAALVREQARSQNQASAAGERIASIVRNASVIQPVGSDSTETTLNRILYRMPDPNAGGALKNGVIAFVEPSAETESDGVIKVFENEADYNPATVKTAVADHEFQGIQDLAIDFKTSTWMTMRVFYSYRSYKNFAARDNAYQSKLAGEFVTDIIAKNHHPGESAHYAETTTSLFLL